ncbi:ABC transporter substrate-binding protein [Pectobacterium polonicum]|uniref:ABC transporter substrate-binding protein n=1 Tax=Pectobacterium polonicum TaxID=2485124 RepID=A0AAE9NQ99_9GAMM|nr:ABC transporter substrate-binding protein [Pectobacterium polonicum]MDC9818549.1 ABC transporter substrate-binding protein [Pectobacterium polonicum]UVO07003.1 ABC transporter substrate-binding protein [Pectobacterium polonicum]
MTKKLTRLLLASAIGTALLTASVSTYAETANIVLNTTVNTFDPHMTASVGSDLSVLSHIYPALLLRGPDRQLHPELATSWKAVNETTWRFTLVSGAKFSNGEPLDAEAVKWNLDRVRDPKVNARIKAWFSQVADVKVISPTELDVITASPYPSLADQISMFLLLPPKWASSHNPATETLSGGRYSLVENVPGDHITLKENATYFGQKPAFDTVVFRIIPEPASRIAALLAGEVSLITAIPTSEVERVNKSGKAEAGSLPSMRSVMIKFNTEKAPLDNKAVRQALNYAIDKEGISTALFNGQAAVSQCQVLTPAYFGYNPDLQAYAYDPAKARDLLKKSGADLSKPIALDVPTATYLQGNEVAQVVAAQLTELGLRVSINEMEFSNYMNKYLKTHDLAQTSLLAQAWPTLDADGLLTLFAPGNNYAYWNNAAFGQALDKGRASLDPAVRLAEYKKATQIMCDDAPAIFLYAQPSTYGVAKAVHWDKRGDDWVRAFDMTPVK